MSHSHPLKMRQIKLIDFQVACYTLRPAFKPLTQPILVNGQTVQTHQQAVFAQIKQRSC